MEYNRTLYRQFKIRFSADRILALLRFSTQLWFQNQIPTGGRTATTGHDQGQNTRSKNESLTETGKQRKKS